MAPTKRKAGDGGTAGKKKLQRRNATNASRMPTQRRVTRQMTTDGPRQAVFATAELLENIMLHLPIRTIYTSQRVCQQFRDIVKTSVVIQQKLFIRPTLPDDKVWELRRGPNYDPSRAPHFVSVPGDPSGLKKGQFRPVRLAPLFDFGSLSDFGSRSLRDSGRVFDSARRLNVRRTENVRSTVEKSLKFRHIQERGLWCSAQLTDPPCQLAEIEVFWCMRASGHNTATGWLGARIEKPEGITIAHLWDAMMNAKPGHCWTGSQYHYIEEKSFAELHTQLVQEGLRPATFNMNRMYVSLRGVVIASKNEWKNVCGDGNQVEEQEKTP